MKNWWVNHKQTHRAEIEGGYIWSPKTNANGSRNQTYINLSLARLGDKVYSFADAQIKAAGIVTNTATEQAKPEEFGKAGETWAESGWLVGLSP